MGSITDWGGKIINDFGLDNDLISTSELISPEIEYDFRDNFLQNTVKGQTYIDYYYKLSLMVQLYKPLNVSNFTDHFSLAQGLVGCAYKLQYGNNGDIPITTSLKNDILDMIDYYRNISVNDEFQGMLDQIESDVNYYEGWTRSAILSDID